MAMFAMELAATRRSGPAEDLVTLLLGAEFDGEPMTDLAFGSFFVQLVVAGNDTSRTMLSSAILALLQHPDQLAELRDDRVAARPERSRRCCAGRTRCTTSAAPRPTDVELGGTSDRRGRQAGDDLHLGEPRRGGVRRSRTASTSTAARTRTCRSASASTSAWVCTWPGSRAGCSSTRSWTAGARFELAGEPSGSART